jgi:hypothetical protein
VARRSRGDGSRQCKPPAAWALFNGCNAFALDRTRTKNPVTGDADAWMGLIAPGGTPKPMVAAISKDVAAIIKLPEVREKLATQLMVPVGNSPEAFRALIDREIERWAPVIKAADVKVN